ncbi:hypothetical protein WJX72_008843 [[Myrmecia] bisecta]|uniref:Fungal lipase-type domain-containing protein n=1 Tax=[Myrmecia] bisecta TaxID=41462 RepID=A0AAW1QRY5_9CHLO
MGNPLSVFRPIVDGVVSVTAPLTPSSIPSEWVELVLKAVRSAVNDNTPLGRLKTLAEITNKEPAQTRNKELLEWLQQRGEEVFKWFIQYANTVAYWAYQAGKHIPLLKFFLLGSEWGDRLWKLHSQLAIERHWGERLGDASDETPVEHVSFLLVGMFISRLDFVIRFFFSLLYGTYTVTLRSDGRADELPVLYSLLNYIDVTEGTNVTPLDLPEAPSPARETLSKLSTGDTSPTVPEKAKLLAEAAWLAYEEPVVIADVLKNKWPEKIREIHVLDFVSVQYQTYKPGEEEPIPGSTVEHPLDTQCLLFTCGEAVFLSFRGSQPINFFDWFYNFSINSATNKADINAVPVQPAGARSNSDARFYRMHQGFAANLGLPLKDANGREVAKASTFQVQQHKPTADQTWDAQIAKEDGSPFEFLRNLVRTQMGSSKTLYITGHSLGGAMGVVFAVAFALQPDEVSAAPERIHLYTFGQPKVGDAALAAVLDSDEGLADRYVRVVNHNDGIARAPYFFFDSGYALVHAGNVLYINADGELANQALTSTPADEHFERMLHHSVRKLLLAWNRLNAQPNGDSMQSTARFLVRLLLTPLLVINDHADYKWLLRNQEPPQHVADVEELVAPSANIARLILI